jgi:LysR family transcriptional regulator for metE and metH
LISAGGDILSTFLKQIQLFVAVAKHQNLGRTAERMHISASSVCQRLKSLENELGVQLYQRKKEGIELTGAGQTLLATANTVLGKLDAVKETLTRNSAKPEQSLSVGGTYNPSEKYLPAAIAAFRSVHPEVKLKFITGDRLRIQKLLRRSELDIAMVQTPSQSADFALEHYSSDNLTCFAHAAHPLTKKKKLNVQDFARAPLIVRAGWGTTEKMLKQLAARGIAHNVVLRCTTPNAVKAAVRKKMGVGILFSNQIERDLARKDVKVLNFVGLPKLVGSSYIVYYKKRPLPPAAAEFLDFLRAIKTPEEHTVGEVENESGQ